MSANVPMIKVDTKVTEKKSEQMFPNVIEGVIPYQHALKAGSTLRVEPDNQFHIFIMIFGDAEFITDGNSYTFHECVLFCGDHRLPLEIKTQSDTEFLEIQRNITQEDLGYLHKYETDTKYPLIQIYRNAKQYTDDCKSEKTINRIMLEQRHIPRFCCGSVEMYGPDAVTPHAHPTLDQFFYSFPENDMDCILDGEKVPMGGNVFLHIPLGGNHGVDLQPGKHCHYMWLDFFVEPEEKAAAGLDRGHIATGKHMEFNEKGELIK